ncbi:MAG TPA: hypothetical protein VFI16_11570 [Anaeromyxobacteraceae bacterium]|nr:hypothetical protein [Anaeromyxobacteraceae bacterium]
MTVDPGGMPRRGQFGGDPGGIRFSHAATKAIRGSGGIATRRRVVVLYRAMAQSLADILALARKMFAREGLPELEPQEAPRRAGPGALRLLLDADPLPFDPVEELPRGRGPAGRVLGREELPLDLVPPTPRRPGVLASILTPEDLPLDPVPPAPRRRGVLAPILGPEALPEDPPGPPRNRSRWLAWLFSPEDVDPS